MPFESCTFLYLIPATLAMALLARPLCFVIRWMKPIFSPQSAIGED